MSVTEEENAEVKNSKLSLNIKLCWLRRSKKFKIEFKI